MNNKIIQKWLEKGVVFQNPATTYIEENVTLEKDCIIGPMVVITGNTHIKSCCKIGPFSYIDNSKIGSNCTIISSTIIDSELEGNNSLGPYSYLRGKSIIKNKAQLGAHCEINDTILGEGSKCKHFSYLGHAEIGTNVNIGAGTITCNFDGNNKHITNIQDNAFIGSGSLLIAPIKIEENVLTGAGSVVTKDIPKNSKVYGVPARIQ